MESSITIQSPRPANIYGWQFYLIATLGCILTFGGLALLRLYMTIHSTGTVAALEESYVFAPEDSTVSEILAQIGDEVKEGTPLFRLNDAHIHLLIIETSKALTQLQSSLEMNEMAIKELDIRPANPEVLSAKDRLEQLNRIKTLQQESMESLEKLIKLQLVGTPEYNRQQEEMIRTDMDRLQASTMAQWGDAGLIQVQRDRLTGQSVKLKELIQLSQQEIDYFNQQASLLTVKANMSGKLVSNDYRYSGMAVAKGVPMAKIARMNGKYCVKAYVSEHNIDLLEVGTRARMSSEVFDSVFEGYIWGKVSRIIPESETDTLTRSHSEDPIYEVEILIDTPPRELILSSRVEVDFMINRISMFDFLTRRYKAKTVSHNIPEKS